MPNLYLSEYVPLTNIPSINVLIFPTVLLDFPTIHRLFTKNPYLVKKEGKILIIDDNKELLVALKLILSSHFEIINTETNPNLIPTRMLSETFDIILLDMNFSTGINTGNEGLYWLRQIMDIDPEACVVFITAFGDVELAVKSIREGATDFIQKSWDEEKILYTILSALKLRKSKLEIRKLKDKQNHLNESLNVRDYYCKGNSESMKKIFETIDKVAGTDANVIILGENGTGKEVIAREIHNKSNRSKEIFVSVDISSLSESLFESELFGHVKGAFTDAISERVGRFEIASGGTLFLDEIGNLMLTLQSKLLSAIQNKEITKVGSSIPIPFDSRLICATNKNIYQMIHEHQFREDLLYRINTIQIELPPLRDRIEDIQPLAEHFLAIFSEKYQKGSMHFSSTAIKYLMEQSWRGNIRELKHTIEKAVILTDSSMLTSKDFSLQNRVKLQSEHYNSLNLSENEKIIIIQALNKSNGNMSLTARTLGINRTTLYDKIKKYDI